LNICRAKSISAGLGTCQEIFHLMININANTPVTRHTLISSGLYSFPQKR
jgi:hypothetical protein